MININSINWLDINGSLYHQGNDISHIAWQGSSYAIVTVHNNLGIYFLFKRTYMQHKILRTTKIDAIKNAFIKQFPYLKLEFFDHKGCKGRSTSPGNKVYGNDPLEAISDSFKQGKLIIKPTDTIEEVMQVFLRNFGLFVQVFRKQDGSWIETISTHRLTVEEQNEIGRKACKVFAAATPTGR